MIYRTSKLHPHTHMIKINDCWFETTQQHILQQFESMSELWLMINSRNQQFILVTKCNSFLDRNKWMLLFLIVMKKKYFAFNYVTAQGKTLKKLLKKSKWFWFTIEIWQVLYFHSWSSSEGVSFTNTIYECLHWSSIKTIWITIFLSMFSVVYNQCLKLK